eukprot:g3829.t1
MMLPRSKRVATTNQGWGRQLVYGCFALAIAVHRSSAAVQFCMLNEKSCEGRLHEYRERPDLTRRMDSRDHSAPVLEDMDADGDLDIVVGHWDMELLYMENCGNATNPIFKKIRSRSADPTQAISLILSHYDGRGYFKPTMADIDGDGDPDMIVGEVTGKILYFENIGDAPSIPSFKLVDPSPFSKIDIGDRSAPVLKDIDGDGDLDLLVGERYGGVKFFVNVGTTSKANFVKGNDLVSPPGQDEYLSAAPAIGDVDGDGDLDMFVGNSEGKFIYFENTGTQSSPVFRRSDHKNSLDFDVGTYAMLDLADLDGDNDLDVVAGDRNGRIHYFENIGSASRAVYTPRNTAESNPLLGAAMDSRSAPELIDFDGDGLLDIIVATGTGDAFLFKNEGNSSGLQFFQVQEPSDNPFYAKKFGSKVDFGVGDIDGDGDADLIAASSLGISYFENVASYAKRTFVRRMERSTNPFFDVHILNGARVELGDIDGDGDIDLFVGNYDGTIDYYENIGTPKRPAFERCDDKNPMQNISVTEAASPSIGDVDRDGDLDLILGNYAGEILFFENTGSYRNPAFTRKNGIKFNIMYGVDVGYHSNPKFGDVDNDGDLDIIIGDLHAGITFMENVESSSGVRFSLRSGPQRNYLHKAIGEVNSQLRNIHPLLGDIDSDGDFDLLVGTYGNLLYLVALSNIFMMLLLSIRIIIEWSFEKRKGKGLAFANTCSKCLLRKERPTPLEQVEPSSGTNELGLKLKVNSTFNPALDSNSQIYNNPQVEMVTTNESSCNKELTELHTKTPTRETLSTWTREYDEASSKFYLFNEDTGESKWEEVEPVSALDDSAWEREYDEASSKFYMFNEITGESKWEE